MMTPDTEKIFKELQEIQSRIPSIWLSSVVTEEPYTPNLKEVVERALEEDNFPEHKKEELRRLKASGDLDRKIPRENPRVAKLINDFIEKEIKKKQKSGLLPKKIENINGLKEIYAKVHQGSNKGKNTA